jgi:RNA polymerase sigma-70 factor, ECF subfamily
MIGANWLTCALSFATFSVIKGEGQRGAEEAESAETVPAEFADQESVLPAEQRRLLDSAALADPKALSALYDQYNVKIYNYIYHRVGQVEVAEDLTAMVFMKMLEAVRDGRAWRTSFSGWLYRIAHNLVIDHYRRRGRAAFVDLDEATPISDGEDPLHAIESRLEGQRVQAALSRLTGEQADVITLRFLEGLSIAEAALSMGKTEGAIKALQYRAVLALRRVMQE